MIDKNDALYLILNELNKAESKYPLWPEDVIHAVAIMIEEAGESMKAALEYVYESGSRDDLIKELAQTGAMVLRVLMHSCEM